MRLDSTCIDHWLPLITSPHAWPLYFSASFSFLYFSLDGVSCSMIDWPQALYVAKDDFELLFILLLPSNNWGYRHAPLYPALYLLNTPKPCLQLWESGLTNKPFFLYKTHSRCTMRWAKWAQIKDMCALQCLPMWELSSTTFLSSETK